MYFKKLEILGFKSFADKTVLNFEPGITAIVGPNGCGKSNIFDAIRWVLGEQSVKSLRGTSMEDVIFNGTDNKAGVGFAEVSLTFANESKILPIEYDEVTVTRRLFRSGESEYLLNKTQVRLKDVLELFMGTGIGAESYSLVEQGRIDLIISSKPEDRRLIFDEAAGITKYKSKKREALNKLEGTENNLLRINDIIVEVKRQIGSIERQANKARRYKEEFEKLKELEIKFAAFEVNNLKSELQRLLSEALILKDKEAKANNEIEELNKKHILYNSNLEELKTASEEIKTQDFKSESSIEMDTKHIELNKERIVEASKGIARLEEQRNQIDQRLLTQKEKIEKLKSEIYNLNDFKENNTSLLNEKTKLLEQIALILKKAQEDIAKSKKAILEITSSQSKIKNELTDCFTQMQQLLARKRRLELEKTKVTSEKQEEESNLEGVLKKIKEVQSKINSLSVQKQDLANSLLNLQEQLKAIKQNSIDLEKEEVTLESQEEFIEDLKLQYQEMPQAIKAILLTSEVPDANTTGILGKVKEVIPIEDKFKVFLEGSVIKEDIKQIKQVICETKFIELDSQKIAQRIEQVLNSIEKLRQEELSLNSKIEIENAKLKELDNQIHQEQISQSNEELRKNNILELVNKFNSELDLISDELKETEVSLEKLKIKDSWFKEQSEAQDAQFNQTQNAINSNQELISLKTKEREGVCVNLAQIETELSSFKDKETSLKDSLISLEETQNHDCGELKRIEKESQELTQKISTIEANNIELEQKINQALTHKQSLQLQFKETDLKINNLTDIAKEEQAKIGLFRQELDKIINISHEIKMQEQELSFKEQSIKERLLQSYKANLEELKSICQEAIDVSLLSNQIAQLKKRVESFGNVNLVAIEEYEELKQRFEFLNQQREDLLAAKEQLHSTISKINRTTKQLFLDTFEKVKEEFKIYFKLLFGGGEAQLILINSEDVLETGIEIVVRPPGKKLQSISLLSGGEKALTAAALIFGVFKVKPSPFCILDEIDAALDESNIGRFAYLLKDFAKISQFIIITHNKKTIVNADVMYGITMQETGISKIVSVKFANRTEENITEDKKEVVASPA
ncbi:MAG: AAA family ATPase [Candidatus Omnitrophota bacterium]|nr:AAA family ATPase [Candidatus Omnitrophota bacterium]